MTECEEPQRAVASFATTSDAMAVQAAASGGVPGRMVPIPAALSAGCGLAWEVPVSQADELRRALEERSLAFEGIYLLP